MGSHIKILYRNINSPYPSQLCRDIELLCCDTISPCLGQLYRDIKILSCNRVGQGRENFCHDRGFLCCDRAGNDRKLYCTRHGWAYEGWHAPQCGTVLCHDRGGHERATDQAPHDRARLAKAGAHDSVAPCCVAIEEAMRARQTMPVGYDKGARVTGEFYHNREFSVETDLDSDKKKKKTPRVLGRHSLVSELRYTNYLELNVWYKNHILVLGLKFMIT